MINLLKDKEKLNIFSKIRDFYFPKDIKDHLRIKATVGKFIVTLFFFAGLSFAWFFVPQPKAASVNIDTAYSLDQRVTIDFSRPVKRNEIVAEITPDTKGSWSWEKSYLGSNHLFTRLVFTPKEFYRPENDYTVSLKNISGIVNITKETASYNYSFKTQSMPKLAKVTPGKDVKDVLISSKIELNLDQKNENLAEFSLETEPRIEFDKVYDNEKMIYSFFPKKQLEQGTLYRVKVYRTNIIYDLVEKKVVKKDDPELVYEGAFTTKNAPEIFSFSPNGSQILVGNDTMKIVFTQEMDKKSVEANTTISPTIEGAFEWTDNRTMLYKFSKKLSYGTRYNMTIKQGAKNSVGGYISKDITGGFTTIGNVYVYAISPYNGQGGVSKSANVSITFDQAVDHTSAQNHFSISDGRAGTFGWYGNTMTFNPNNDFSNNSTYTVTMKAGVKSINGLDSTRAFSATFYTEQSYVKLAVPLDYQDYPLSCEVASLKMALRYRGIYVSENELMSWIGYDPTPHIGNTWGDPYNAFVGSINGRQNTTGYGVYWEPIAKSARHYRNAQAFTGWSASQLAAALAAGNPVVIWGVYPGGYYDPWYTPGGKFINAWKGEHVRTAIGFVGSVSNPTQFIINDPVAGTLYWSKGQLLADWSKFGYAGVVVY